MQPDLVLVPNGLRLIFRKPSTKASLIKSVLEVNLSFAAMPQMTALL